MPHNVRISVVGVGEYMTKLVRLLLEKQIVPANNMFLDANNHTAVSAAEGYPVSLSKDAATAVVQSEIVLVCAPGKEMATAIAPISQCTRGKTLVSISEASKVNVEYVAERTAFGTQIIAATLQKDENDKLSVSYEIAKNVRLFLHQPCRDMVNVLCEE